MTMSGGRTHAADELAAAAGALERVDWTDVEGMTAAEAAQLCQRLEAAREATAR